MADAFALMMNKSAVGRPEGLTILKKKISEKEQKHLLDEIDTHPWSNVLQRRVQMYGGMYDYQKRKVIIEETNVMTMSNCPGKALLVDILTKASVSSVPDFNQCIINEYEKGQSISAHTDASCFGPIICSISLGEDTTMIFTNIKSKEKYSVVVQKGDIMIMCGDSRYLWTHQTTKVTNKTNYRRVSITFRTM
jgi:alkylated DNA repair dioxygenase AlkB